MGYTSIMAKHRMSLAETLRRAARDSGRTVYRLAADAGIDRSALLRFVTLERGLNIESAGRLADALNLELRPRKAGD